MYFIPNLSKFRWATPCVCEIDWIVAQGDSTDAEFEIAEKFIGKGFEWQKHRLW